MQSPERLRLLLVLTVCDIRAVGPKVWNGWKAALLRQLYYARRARCCRAARCRAAERERIKRVQAERRPALWPSWTEAEKDEHFAPRLCRLLAVVRSRHACAPGRAGARRRARPASRSPSSTASTATRAVTEVTIYTLDHAGLFARIAGAHGDQRRQHRRRQDLHPGQRHGARHVLDPGRRGQAVRRAAPPGAARRPRRAGAVRPPRHRSASSKMQRQLVARARPRLHRAAARADRQPRLRHPHGDRGQRPRPARAAARS